MRTITFKAGRRVWLMLVDGCEVGTNVPVSQPVDRAVLVAARMFPGAVIDRPKQTRSVFAEIAPENGTHNMSSASSEASRAVSLHNFLAELS